MASDFEDFPAAHSMDTAWFAVDRDGHVAFFSTGEAGALPHAAFSGEEAYELASALPSILPATSELLDHVARVLPAHPPEHSYLPRPEAARAQSSFYGALFFLANVAPYQAEISKLRAVRVASRAPHALIFTKEGYDAATFETFTGKVHAAGDCLGCSWHFQDDRSPAASGVYEYDHLCENWIAGPYGRVASPAKPAKLDELPPAIAKEVAKLRFANLCFEETPHIQPIEHTDCANYDGSGSHLRVDGTRVGDLVED